MVLLRQQSRSSVMGINGGVRLRLGLSTAKHVQENVNRSDEQ